MKTLFLVRHAKTRKAEHGEDDHGRPLLPEGETAALTLGRDLARDKRIPSIILSSDSLRTRQTSMLIQEGIYKADSTVTALPALYLQQLYSGGPDDILALLAGRTEDSVMIVGHNPSMTEASETLGGEYEHMRPGTCIVMIWDIDRWEGLYAHPLPVETHHYRTKGD